MTVNVGRIGAAAAAALAVPVVSGGAFIASQALTGSPGSHSTSRNVAGWSLAVGSVLTLPAAALAGHQLTSHASGGWHAVGQGLKIGAGAEAAVAAAVGGYFAVTAATWLWHVDHPDR